MNSGNKQTRYEGKANNLTIGLLENPLDYIAEDHMREREICAIMDRLVLHARPNEDECRQIVSFLAEQLPHHLADEEIDLFPMMLDRCEPEDEIQKVIDALLYDHRHAFAVTPQIIDAVSSEGILDVGLSEKSREQMNTFADQARRHLIIENAIILPIARARMLKEDLAIMKEHMIERRNCTPSLEARGTKVLSSKSAEPKTG